MGEMAELPPADPARQKFEQGMTNLGRSLRALGILQLLAGILVALSGDRLMLLVTAVLGGHAVLLYGAAYFAFRHRVWINYAVGLWAGLGLVGNCTYAAIPAGNAPVGIVIGILVFGLLTYYTLNNLALYSKVGRSQ